MMVCARCSSEKVVTLMNLARRKRAFRKFVAHDEHALLKANITKALYFIRGVHGAGGVTR
ncbi:MAG: hypothetical protein Ct9H300mP7_2530 [Verrucomicrobiota bacterium]|nr:MAG: hypothetical protein Ct9H300mP7_2530 [Verrucomicrobiota bacterium]